jgi:hypothetical protein
MCLTSCKKKVNGAHLAWVCQNEVEALLMSVTTGAQAHSKLEHGMCEVRKHLASSMQACWAVARDETIMLAHVLHTCVSVLCARHCCAKEATCSP